MLPDGTVDDGCRSVSSSVAHVESLVAFASRLMFVRLRSVVFLVLPLMAISKQDHLYPITWLWNVRRRTLPLEYLSPSIRYYKEGIHRKSKFSHI